MGRVYSIEGAYEREMTKWEARDGPMGPGLRPYVKREYPMMLHHATAALRGGFDIDAQEIVHTEGERARLEARGFRATPLEAIDAVLAEQTEHATLAAERNFEVRRMSPQARAEVERAEESAGTMHLPTIPETSHGVRGVPVKLSAEDVDRTILENAEEQVRTQQTELDMLRTQLEAQNKLIEAMNKRMEEAAAAVPSPRKRGRPKKAEATA